MIMTMTTTTTSHVHITPCPPVPGLQIDPRFTRVCHALDSASPCSSTSIEVLIAHAKCFHRERYLLYGLYFRQKDSFEARLNKGPSTEIGKGGADSSSNANLDEEWTHAKTLE